MSGETLKPCPWCNSKAVLWKADNHEEWFIGCGGECSVKRRVSSVFSGS